MSKKLSKNLENQHNPIKKTATPHISRLKKEDEEESWISGEELYTEGSSDEENCHCSYKRSKSKEPCNTSTVSSQEKDKSIWLARKFTTAEESATEDEASTKTNSSDSEEEVTVRDDEISWKVKRGKKSNQLDKLRRNKSNHFWESITNKNKLMNQEIEIIKRLDETVTIFEKKIKVIKQETLEIQNKNRSRLRELENYNPLRSQKINQNTQEFLDLCPMY